MKFVKFLPKKNIRNNASSIRREVYNQIISTLTLSHMSKIFEKRKNFDLRRLLAGSERLIDHLLIHRSNRNNANQSKTIWTIETRCLICEILSVSNDPFIFMTHSVRILPLNPSVRENITNVIQSSCSKIKNLVFAVLIINNHLIALVRMKKYFIHPADLRFVRKKKII